MNFTHQETEGHPSLRAAIRFADYERPAVNGISFSLFITVFSEHGRPRISHLRLLLGAYCVSSVSDFGEHRETLRLLRPGYEDRAVYCHVSINRLLLPREGRLLLVVTEGGTDFCIGWVDIRDNDTQHVVPRMGLRLRPILITSLGRSGSTVLTNSLGSHPRVKAIGAYPFEYRFFSYCLNAVHVLASPASHGASMGGDAFEQRHPFSTGFNPFNHRTYDRLIGNDAMREFYEGRFATNVAHFMLSQADEAHLLVSPEKADAVAFVEKMAGTHLANLAENLCINVAEIVLTREFWSMISSMVAFDAKRGIGSFVSADPKWLLGMAAQHQQLLDRGSKSSKIHVRYEHLVAAPRATLKDVLDRLGLDGEGSALDAVSAPFSAADYRELHATEKMDHAALRRMFPAEILAQVDAILAMERNEDVEYRLVR